MRRGLKGGASEASSVADYGDDKETLKRIHAIYLNSIAQTIAKGSADNVEPFRKPLDTQAYRIAAEYVADYLATHLMTFSSEAISTETDAYIRQRHDHTWVARKLRIKDDSPFMQQLLESLRNDSPSTVGSTASRSTTGRRHHPKASATGTATGTGTNTQDSLTKSGSRRQHKKRSAEAFIESQDMSLFTNIMATGAGYEERDNGSIIETGMTFTTLAEPTIETNTENETTYDPRGVKKVKRIPHLKKSAIEMKKSQFIGHEPITTIAETEIDTVANTMDRMEIRRKRREMRDEGFLTGATTTINDEESATFATTESFLHPKPRYVEPTIDETWEELENPPPETIMPPSKSPFASRFPEIVERKKKFVAMGLQTDRPGAIRKHQMVPGVVPAPPLPSDILDALRPPNERRLSDLADPKHNAAVRTTDERGDTEEDDFEEEEEEETEGSSSGSSDVAVELRPTDVSKTVSSTHSHSHTGTGTSTRSGTRTGTHTGTGSRSGTQTGTHTGTHTGTGSRSGTHTESVKSKKSATATTTATTESVKSGKKTETTDTGYEEEEEEEYYSTTATSTKGGKAKPEVKSEKKGDSSTYTEYVEEEEEEEEEESDD